MTRIAKTIIVLGMAAACAVACSLVNAYDPLLPPDAPGDSAADVFEAATLDAGPPQGVIVVSGLVDLDGGGQKAVLSVIDPIAGRELSRESTTVTAISYDTLRDLWYLFVSAGGAVYAQPTDSVHLEVRQLDTHTGVWSKLGSVAVLPNVPLDVTALNARIGYVGWLLPSEAGATDVRPDNPGPPVDAGAGDGADGNVEDGSADDGGGDDGGEDGGTVDATLDAPIDGPSGVVAIDVSDAAGPFVYSIQALNQLPLGVVGTPSGNGAGGIANLVEQGKCDGSTCVQFHRVLFAPNAPPTLNNPVAEPTALYASNGNPGFGFAGAVPGGFDVVATRVTGQATLQSFLPQSNQRSGTPVNFDMNGSFLKPIAFADCLQVALVVETNTDLEVHAVPLNGATASHIPTGHSGQGVYFEPYTSTVLVPFSQGPGFAFTAFTLGGTSDAPTLAPRVTAWSPPADLRPIFIATRRPNDFVCP